MTVLTAEDVAVLNAARLTLKRVVRRCDDVRGDYEPAAARTAGYAESAEHALFMTLNIADTYLDLDLGDDVLHGPTRTAVRAE